MRNKINSGITLSVAAAVTLVLSQTAGAQGAAKAPEGELEQVVVTGTRVANRSVLETSAPVDIVSADALQNLGVTEINQALSVTLPSFNFPRPGLTDGTDTVRPATLRGLAPDQTLVLVNGKRRHAAALVNVNGSIGRGAASADLNAIPNTALKTIKCCVTAPRRSTAPMRSRASSTCVCAKTATAVKRPCPTAGAIPPTKL